MNLLDLHRSSVHFDEQSHTYTTTDGVSLSGVTSIIKQVLFPDKYRGIPEGVLAKAAERGTEIHNECEDINLLGASSLSDFSSMEARIRMRGSVTSPFSFTPLSCTTRSVRM